MKRYASRVLLVVAIVAAAQHAAAIRGEMAAAVPVPQPPARLEETGLYAPDWPHAIDPRNRPFSPQYPLWSDGAEKARWVYLPEGARIEVDDDGGWQFPVGTRFWKEFSFGGRKVETRLLWKASPARWVPASYVWNAEGTAATLAPEHGVRGVAEIAPGRRHAIPSRSDCAACHGDDDSMAPLGFTALQLSTDRDPNAIHAEPPVPGMVTLDTLRAHGILPASRRGTPPPRIATSNPRTRAVLGYLMANCGSCHNGRGEISALGPVLRSSDLLRDAEMVARSLLAQPTKWQVPGLPDGASLLIDPAAAESSALLVRMRSRRPSTQMPPLASVVRDQVAVDAIARWIALDLRPAHESAQRADLR